VRGGAGFSEEIRQRGFRNAGDSGTIPTGASRSRPKTRQVNPGDVSARNEAQLLGQVFETGHRGDPAADCYSDVRYSAQSFETLEARILRASDLVPKLTVSEKVRLV
jgi:hypothetical protein